jgi:hypothetical protein
MHCLRHAVLQNRRLLFTLSPLNCRPIRRRKTGQKGAVQPAAYHPAYRARIPENFTVLQGNPVVDHCGNRQIPQRERDCNIRVPLHLNSKRSRKRRVES